MNVIKTVKLIGVILNKVVELHSAGVDKVILHQIHKSLLETHDTVDEHHKEHVTNSILRFIGDL